MARTNEAIFNRASEEHIRQPIPYDDVDSVKVLDSHFVFQKLFGQQYYILLLDSLCLLKATLLR